MRFEGPDISQIVALTGFVLSAAVILAIIANPLMRVSWFFDAGYHVEVSAGL